MDTLRNAYERMPRAAFTRTFKVTKPTFKVISAKLKEEAHLLPNLPVTPPPPRSNSIATLLVFLYWAAGERSMAVVANDFGISENVVRGRVATSIYYINRLYPMQVSFYLLKI